MTNLPFKLVLLAALMGCLLSGCAGAAPPITHTIQLEDAQSSNPVAGAAVTVQAGVRNIQHAETGPDGTVQFSFDPATFELHHWVKVVVEADGYQRESLLVEVTEENPTTVVKLSEPGQPPTAEPQPAQTEATQETPPTPEPEAALPPAGPLADIPPAERANYYDTRPEMSIGPTKSYRAVIKTNKGDIVLSLDARAAPEQVNNFIFLANQGFYDGLTFHRVEPGFVIQGGDPEGSGQGGPGYTIPGEFDLLHGEGALAMARLPDEVNPERESSGSQFYITLAATPFLDGQYSVFGQVEQGMDVVKAIEVGDVIERIIIQE